MAEPSSQSASKGIGQNLRRSARLKVPRDEAPPAIADKSINNPIINADAEEQPQTSEEAIIEAFMNKVAARKNRILQAKLLGLPRTVPEIVKADAGEHEEGIKKLFWIKISEIKRDMTQAEPPSTTNASPVTVTTPVKLTNRVQDELSGQEMRRTTLSVVPEEKTLSTGIITDSSVNHPAIDADAGVQEKKTEPALRKSLRIKIPSKKSYEAKAQPSKPPSTIRVGPVTVTVPVKPKKGKQDEPDRKRELDEDLACLLVTNSKHIVYCRPCKISIQLEQKSANYGGYYTDAWKKHTDRKTHREKEKEWNAQGGHNVPKEQDQQWKAEWTSSGKRWSDGSPKMSYNLVRVEAPSSGREASTS